MIYWFPYVVLYVSQNEKVELNFTQEDLLTLYVCPILAETFFASVALLARKYRYLGYKATIVANRGAP